MGRYGNLAKTGGFTPLDVANMRGRAMAPSRGIFDAARRDIGRFGGPARTAALSRLQRQTGQQMSDAATAAESDIARLKQTGQIQGLQGMSNMFSATPGMANMFRDQVNQTTAAMGQHAGLQNQLGLGTMNAQIAAGHLPGTMDSWLNRGQMIGNIAGSAAGILRNKPGTPSTTSPGNIPPSMNGEWTGAENVTFPGAPTGTPSGAIPPSSVPSVTTASSYGLPSSSIPAANSMYGPANIASQNLTGGMGGAGIQGGQIAGLTGGVGAGGGAGLLASGSLPAGMTMNAVPASIASQGVSSGVGASGGGAGGTGALGTAGYAVLPAAAAALTYGIGEKGLFRGGMEGAYTSPQRDRMSQYYQQQFGGASPYEGMVNGLASQGVVGPQAEQLIRQFYEAKTPDQFRIANEALEFASATPEKKQQLLQQKQNFAQYRPNYQFGY